jgi:undecaprenyl-diphosphatase
MRLATSGRYGRLLGVVARRDAALFDLICAHRTHALTRLMIAATRSGDAWTYLALGLTGIALGGSFGAALVRAAVAAGAACVLGYVPKRLIARPRPTHASPFRVALLDPPDAWSFPSSHTAAAVAAACVLGAALGPAALVPALLWAIVVGVSRVYVGAHYPLDVVMGGALGAIVAIALGC